MKKKWTREQAIMEFHRRWASLMELDSRWENDNHVKRGCWETYTDKLCKDGDITEQHKRTWSNPFK